MDNQIKKCPWQEIHGFQSPEDFEEFENWIKAQIELGNAEEIKSKVQRAGSYIITQERWFKYVRTGEVWRLEDPDPPCYGTFEQDKTM